jgi:hypothetical protein
LEEEEVEEKKRRKEKYRGNFIFLLLGIDTRFGP